MADSHIVVRIRTSSLRLFRHAWRCFEVNFRTRSGEQNAPGLRPKLQAHSEQLSNYCRAFWALPLASFRRVFISMVVCHVSDITIKLHKESVFRRKRTPGSPIHIFIISGGFFMHRRRVLKALAGLALCQSVRISDLPRRKRIGAYEGAHGPAHWGDLEPADQTCSVGCRQSPISIDSTIEARLATARIRLGAAG